MARFDADHASEDLSEDAPKSKSQIKREIESIRTLADDLLALSAKDIQKLQLSATVTDALLAGQTMQKGARKRQLGFLTRLLSEHESVESVQQRYADLMRPNRQQTAVLHQVERWRDELIANHHAVFDALRTALPELDIQRVRQWVRQAQQEQRLGESPKAARALFRYLHAQYTARDAASSDPVDG